MLTQKFMMRQKTGSLFYRLKLVGGDWDHGILGLSHHIGNVIIPTDELIFFRGVETTNQEGFLSVYR